MVQAPEYLNKHSVLRKWCLKYIFLFLLPILPVKNLSYELH